MTHSADLLVHVEHEARRIVEHAERLVGPGLRGTRHQHRRAQTPAEIRNPHDDSPIVAQSWGKPTNGRRARTSHELGSAARPKVHQMFMGSAARVRRLRWVQPGIRSPQGLHHAQVPLSSRRRRTAAPDRSQRASLRDLARQGARHLARQLQAQRLPGVADLHRNLPAAVDPQVAGPAHPQVQVLRRGLVDRDRSGRREHRHGQRRREHARRRRQLRQPAHRRAAGHDAVHRTSAGAAAEHQPARERRHDVRAEYNAGLGPGAHGSHRSADDGATGPRRDHGIGRDQQRQRPTRAAGTARLPTPPSRPATEGALRCLVIC